jgi:virulence-associated protein VapD
VVAKVNHDEIDDILDYIEAHPEEWDQRVTYIKKRDCGTVYCVAGFAVVRKYHHIDEWGVGVWDQATDILGLNYDQAYRLFQRKNTLDDLRKIAKDFRIEEEQGEQA